MKINKVERLGFIDLRRIINYEDYLGTQAQLLIKNVRLRDIASDYFKENNDLRILMGPLTIKLHTNYGVLYYHFKVGYMTDLASVPKKLRSIVDNDSEELMLPALVHDANFGCHYFSFGQSNDIFRNMIRKAGGSWWLGFICHLSVSGDTGFEAYENKPFAGAIEYDRNFVKFEWKDK